MVYPPTGLTAYVREMNTPPTLLLGYGPPLPCFLEGKLYIQLSSTMILINALSYIKIGLRLLAKVTLSDRTVRHRTDDKGTHSNQYSGMDVAGR